jgi:hypothetical protein
MATPASVRCGMGWTEMAAWTWGLHVRCGPLALRSPIAVYPVVRAEMTRYSCF